MIPHTNKTLVQAEGCWSYMYKNKALWKQEQLHLIQELKKQTLFQEIFFFFLYFSFIALVKQSTTLQKLCRLMSPSFVLIFCDFMAIP